MNATEDGISWGTCWRRNNQSVEMHRESTRALLSPIAHKPTLPSPIWYLLLTLSRWTDPMKFSNLANPKFLATAAGLSALIIVASMNPVTGAVTGTCVPVGNPNTSTQAFYTVGALMPNSDEIYTIGDKVLSFNTDTAFPGGFASNGLEADDFIIFAENSGVWTVTIDAVSGGTNDYLLSGGEFNYTIATNQPASFSLATATLATTFVPSSDVSTTAEKSSISFLTNPIGNSGSSPANQTTGFVANTKSATITDSWTVVATPATNSIQTLQNAFTQSVKLLSRLSLASQ